MSDVTQHHNQALNRSILHGYCGQEVRVLCHKSKYLSCSSLGVTMCEIQVATKGQLTIDNICGGLHNICGGLI